MVDNIAMLRRNLIDRVLDGLADTPAVLVNGARQTGKSTLVQSPELAKQDRQYLTFDGPGRGRAGWPSRRRTSRTPRSPSPPAAERRTPPPWRPASVSGAGRQAARHGLPPLGTS